MINEKGQYFEEYSINDCDKKSIHMNMCLILNGYQDRIVWIYKYKNRANGNKDTEITYC